MKPSWWTKYDEQALRDWNNARPAYRPWINDWFKLTLGEQLWIADRALFLKYPEADAQDEAASVALVKYFRHGTHFQRGGQA